MKLNMDVKVEKLLGEKVKGIKNKQELWHEIVLNQKNNREEWKRLFNWCKRGHTISTDNKLLAEAFKKSGIPNVILKDISDVAITTVTEGKPVRCKQCGKLFISTGSNICEVCIEENKKNDDPFEVAMQNIEIMLNELHNIDNSKQRYFARREIAWVINQAYHRGYIGEEYYASVCEIIRTTPKYDKVIRHIYPNYYDNSTSAKEGYFTEIMFAGEEE